MLEVFSKGNFVRSSAQKLRLVANLIRGKEVNLALNILNYTKKKASYLIKKVLLSAISNAYNNKGINRENILKISKIYIDSASFTKRIMPRAKGRVNYIIKRTSHINIFISCNE